VSEGAAHGAGRSIGFGSVAIGVTMAAAGSVFLRVLSIEQPAGPRTALVVLVATAGALLALLPFAGLVAAIARNWRPAVRAALAALWMAAAFAPATMFAFAIENRIVEGHIEADSVLDLGARGLFWTLFGGMGLFTPTGLSYLLPWPLAVVAFACGICFYLWPQPAPQSSGASR
jgi:hypothetical protein